MHEQQRTVWTIGHSTHPIDDFLCLLHNHGITAIADVRSMPFSRFNPQFNKVVLERALADAGIRYVFLGRELGARSDDRSCYHDGRVSYSRLAQTASFREGIDRVIKGSETYRIALMCSEKDPLDCHRTILIAEALGRHDIHVQHVLSSGELESHAEALARLQRLHGSNGSDLLPATLTEVLAQQEKKIAYLDHSMASDSEAKAQ